MKWLLLLSAACVDPVAASDLLAVRRIHVERLSGGETATQIRDMIIAALQNTRQFIVTENPERADALLRGSAEDLVFTDVFSSSENIGARASLGSIRVLDNAGRSSSRTPSVSINEQESTRIAERKHEAMAAVRLVAKDGDVLWSTTQESHGGKFRGASADVAEKVVKDLLAELQRKKKSE